MFGNRIMAISRSMCTVGGGDGHVAEAQSHSGGVMPRGRWIGANIPDCLKEIRRGIHSITKCNVTRQLVH